MTRGVMVSLAIIWFVLIGSIITMSTGRFPPGRYTRADARADSISFMVRIDSLMVRVDSLKMELDDCQQCDQSQLNKSGG